MNSKFRFSAFNYSRITGWAFNPDEPQKPVELELWANGECVETFACSMAIKFEGDPATAPASSRVGFRTQLPLRFWTGERVQVLIKERASGATLIKKNLSTPPFMLGEAGERKIYGELRVVTPTSVQGWVTDLEAPLEVDLEVDGVIVAATLADGLVALDKKRLAFFSFDKIPSWVFDGAPHKIEALVPGTGVSFGARDLVFPREAARIVKLRLDSFSAGAIRGVAFTPPGMAPEFDLSLLVNDKPHVATRVVTDSSSAGVFELRLREVDVDDWLGVRISISAAGAQGVEILDADHLIRDAVEVTCFKQADGGFNFSLEAPVALPPSIQIELVVGDETLATRILQNHYRNSKIDFVIEDDLEEEQQRRQLWGLKINDWTFPLDHIDLKGRRLQGIEFPPPSPVQVDLGEFRGPSSVEAGQRLTQIYRKEKIGRDRPAWYTGAWVFDPPSIIRGWAIAGNADNEHLRVAVTIDGEAYHTGVPINLVQPSGANFGFEAAVGFQFDLAKFAGDFGLVSVGVRIEPGAKELGAKDVRVDFDLLEDIAAVEERVDGLVDKGDVVEAYLEASGRRTPAPTSLLDRRYVLDFILRATWHRYDDVLAAGRSGNATVIEVLARYDDWQSRRTGDGFSQRLSQSLPLAYDRLLTASLARRLNHSHDLDSEYDRLRRYAQWTVACGLSGGKPPKMGCRGELLVVVDCDDQAPFFRKDLDELRSSGCVVLLGADQNEILGRIDATLAADGEATVVRLASPAILTAAARYWPALMACCTPNTIVAVDAISVTAGRVTEAAIELAGQGARQSVFMGRFTEKGAAIGLWGAAVGPAPEGAISFDVADIGGVLGAATPYVIHDLPDISRMTMPHGAIIVSSEEDQPLNHVLSGFDWDSIVADLPFGDRHPVICLDRRFVYPDNYVTELAQAVVLNKGRNVVVARVNYDLNSMVFAFDEEPTSDDLFIGHLSLGAFDIKTLAKSAADYGVDGALVAANDRPFEFRKHPKSFFAEGAVAASRRHLALENASVNERQKGFRAAVFGKWRPSFGLSGGRCNEKPAATELTALVRARVNLRKTGPNEDLFAAIRTAAEVGWPDVAREALREVITHLADAEQITDKSIVLALETCKLLGMREELITSIGSRLLLHADETGTSIIPLIEALALSVDRQELGAAVAAFASEICKRGSNKGLYRLAEAIKRYCSPETMVVVVNLLMKNGRSDILKEDPFAAVVGESITGSDIGPSAFMSKTFSTSYFVKRAPLRTQIRAAIDAKDGDLIIALVNRYVAEGHDLRDLVLALRTYSAELTDIDLSAENLLMPDSEIWRNYASALALILGNGPALERFDETGGAGAPASDSVGIVAATYRHDFLPLKHAFEAWAAETKIKTPAFSGEAIGQFFESVLLSAPEKRKAPNFGKASVIVTVYNPDISLLKQALRSVIYQTYPEIEIILVDDGSDLVSWRDIEACKELHSSITCIRMPTNRGPYVCRNEALRLATGEFIIIQDGDDVSHPQRIEEQIAALRSNDNFQMCTAAHLRIDRYARLQFEHTLELRGDGTMTSAFKRGVFDRLGDFLQVRSRGDVEFRQRVTKACGKHVVIHLPIPLVFCYATPQSLSNTTTRRAFDYLASFRSSIDKALAVPILGASSEMRFQSFVEVPSRLRPDFTG